MILWIESQSTTAIAVMVFGFCYILSVVIFVVAILLSRFSFAAELKATTPVMLTPLAVILGLLIAFLASRVWTNIDHANAFVGQEASALRQTLLLADTLPADIRTTLRGAVVKHLEFIEKDDWPAMAEGRATSRGLPGGLTDAITVALAFKPMDSGQELARQRAVIALEQALEARLSRILLSETAIAPIQWLVIIILAALIILTIAMVHLDRRVTTGVNMFIFSSAVATCLVLVMVNDRPFASGGVTVEPTALREIAEDMAEE